MDLENFSTVQAAVSIAVTKPIPTTIKWETPAAIPYGTPLSSTQLNATATVRGDFVYSPAAGDVLTPGRHQLHLRFIPADIAKYATAESMEVIEVEGVANLDSLLEASTQTPFEATPLETNEVEAAEVEDRTVSVDANPEVLEIKSTGIQDREPQTRIYKGAIYERGEDGKWHLQRK
jgi:hypothetical protein